MAMKEIRAFCFILCFVMLGTCLFYTQVTRTRRVGTSGVSKYLRYSRETYSADQKLTKPLGEIVTYHIPTDKEADTSQLEKADEDVSNDDQADEDISQEDQVEEDISQEDQVEEDISQEDQADEDISQEDQVEEDISQEDQADDDISQEDQVEEDISQEDQVEKDISQEDQGDDDISQEDQADEDISQKDQGDDDISQEDQGDDDISQEDQGDDDISQEDQADEDISQKDQGDDDISQEDQGDDDISQEDQGDDDISQEDQADEDISQKDQGDDDISPEGQADEDISPEGQADEDISQEDQADEDISQEDQADEDISREDQADEDISQEDHADEDNGEQNRGADNTSTAHTEGRTGAHSQSPQCPDVLGLMLNGTWRQNPMTEEQRQERRDFYRAAFKQRGLPLNLQRDDMRCGNIPFPKPVDKCRALCDPEGPTPCCYDNICQNKTIAECRCKGCYDMRPLIHTEYSTWLPADSRCEPTDMSVTEICELLKGSTLLFVGDSLMRHLYVAFLMVVRGDEEHGALNMSAIHHKDEHNLWTRCVGKNMFPYGTNCSKWLDKNANLCQGSVNARYISHYSPHKRGDNVIQQVTGLKNRQKGLAILSFGLHYLLNVSTMADKVFLPILDKLKFSKNDPPPLKPRLLWASIHKPGMLKSPIHEKQMFPYVNRFNHEMERFWKPWGVPIFDTVNMTSQGLMSFDGTHYGVRVNKLKATILLHYLQELRAQQKW